MLLANKIGINKVYWTDRLQNTAFSGRLILRLLTLLLFLACVPVSQAEDVLASNANVNFKPVSFKVDVPGGVNYVKWLNAPANLADAYKLETRDGVTYQLNGFAAYRAILDDNITVLQFLITSNAGLTTTLDVPVNIISDPAPQAVFADTSALTLYKGQQTKIPVQLNDVGRNITRIAAVMVDVGVTPNENSLSLGTFQKEKFLGSDYATDIYREAYEATGPVNANNLDISISVSVNQYRATGNYDLYLRVTDSKGNITYSSPRSLVIAGPLVVPSLAVQVPDYRIPPGQPYPIHYQVNHLDNLDRIEISQTGTSGAPFNSVVTLNSAFNASGTTYATIPATANVDDSYNLSVTLYDVNGKSTTTLATVSVGGWGERSVTVTNTAIVNVDETYNYANVTITAGSALRHLDSNIKFNNLTIDAGGVFESRTLNLDVNAALIVNGDLYSATVYNSPLTGTGYTGGGHGGDGRSGPAYDSFRDPKFPGAQGASNSHYYPVDLNITAADITVNGSIRADGRSAISPGGLLSINSNTLAINGSITANASRYAAGGTVNITTPSLSGVGSVSTNGGDDTYNGAGGRIAIHYNVYGNGSIPLKQGLNLSSYPGIATSSNTDVGAGTIFLKRSDQLYGELYIDNGGRAGGTTSLRSVGRHLIQSIVLESGTTDQYRVTVEGTPWTLSTTNNWNLGLQELSVSLDANNNAAAIYPITQLSSNTVLIQSAVDITANVGNDLIGVIRLDKFTVSSAARVITRDRVHSTLFDIVDNASVENINQLYSETVNNIADAVFSAESKVFIGDVNANNLTLNTAALKIHGALNIAGNLTVQDSNYTPLNISGGGTFAAANTTGSVLYQSFTVPQDVRVKVSAISSDVRLAWILFKDDGVLDTADNLGSMESYPFNTTIERVFDLAAGNYILALGHRYLYTSEAISGINDLGGGNVSYTIQTVESYKSLIDATGLDVTGSINVQDTALSLKIPAVINIDTDLNLTSVSQPAVLTIPDAANNQPVNTLLLNVLGAVTVDANSSINLVGKGNYLPQYTGIDDFINPQFAGTGSRAPGGGVLNLVAGSIQLDGTITVDGGVPTYTNYSGGDGGSATINTPVFNGNGRVSADAGFSDNATYLSYSRTGGLISVTAQLDNFSASGQYSSIGGLITTGLANEQGAAGTVYLRANTAQTGHLIVDNTRDTVAQPTTKSTVLRSIGHHTITNVESLGNNDWRISVNGVPWIASTNNGTGLGLVGLEVDLDASDEAGTLYTITSNTPESFILNTADDLSSYINSNLIGVITINQLTVTGGSQLYTGDRLVITTPATSVLDIDSKIIAGQMNELALTSFMANASIGTIELINPLVIADMNIVSGNYIFSGNLPVSNSLTIGAGATVEAGSITTNTISINGGTLNALTLNVTDINLNGGTLITENVTAAGNVFLSNSAILTIPNPTDDRFYDLDLNVAGQLNVELGSIIDLNGKGYTRNYQYNHSFNVFQNWYGGWQGNSPFGCHGGRSVNEHYNAVSPNSIAAYGEFELCVYGDYRQAAYPGIMNLYDEPGGGFGKITANNFVLNGIVRANGMQNPDPTANHLYEGASGGGLHIEVATLSGSGSIETRGGEDTQNYSGNWFYTGAGGRISVYYSAANTFTGNYDSGSGLPSPAGALGSPGTVYLYDQTQNQTHLILDNFNRPDVIATPDISELPTVLRSVGRHSISAIDSLGAGLWRVHINTNKLDDIAENGTLATPQSITYHSFNVPTEQDVQISLSNFGYYYTALLFRDNGTGTLTTTDYVSRSSNQIWLTLQPGDYIVAVASNSATRDEAILGSNSDNTIHIASDGVSLDTTGSLNYTLNIVPSKNRTWRQTAEQNIVGHTVSLDAATPSSSLYPVISNTAESFVIDTQNTALDLSTVVGNDLIGVHVLDTLNVRGKSVLDLGKDRLTLLQPLSSSVEAGSTLIMGEVDSATIESLFTTSAGKIIIKNDLSLNSMTMNNTEVDVLGQLNVNTDLVINGGTLTATNINVGNNLDIINGGLLTVPDAEFISAGSSLNKVYQLVLNVTGAITIDSLSSSINLDGKGYPIRYNGPDFSASLNTKYGCSAGIGGSATTGDCTYGRYEKARFAGSGGNYTGDIGGGSVTITANSLNNDGLISANGTGTTYGGAGGAVHIEVDSHTGTGSIQSNSPGHSSGGRISVQVATTDSFTTTGTYSANSNVYITSVGGAGTVYINSPDYPAGYLKIDNNSNNSLANSTPVRSVGRHTIISATRSDATHVVLTVAGTPGWKTSDPLLDWGLDGLMVDVDASDQTGPLYPITSNTTTTITIDDSAASIVDPSTLVTQDLIGTHTFDRLQVTNGASVDFGADRVIINNAVASDFSNAVQIRMGELNSAAMDILLSQLADTTTLELLGTINATTLNVTTGNITIQGDFTVASNLTLNDTANMEVYGKLTVLGDIAIAANAILTALDATASNVLIDGGTMIASVLNVTDSITILSTTATGVLTVPMATLNPNRIYTLDITAGNNIIVNTGAFIDVSGKGFPARILKAGTPFDYSSGPDFNDRNAVSCHAGKVSSVPQTSMNCQTYGRLEEARFAGSSGQYANATFNGNGGGALKITAPNLNNAGSISADGSGGYYGGAGGSIDLQISTSLQGIGIISANGGGVIFNSTAYRTGGGGRISISLLDSLANGIDFANVQTRGGTSTFSNSGAGTTYLKYTNETLGHLFVDNGGVTASTFSTPVREVGRYVITSATPTGTTNTQGENLYELVIAPADAVHLKTSGVVNATLPGTVVHHSFSLTTARTVNIEINESEFNTQLHLFQDVNGTLNYITTNTNGGRGYQSRITNYSLQPGNYVVAVSGNSTSVNDARDQTKATNNYFGAYQLNIDTLYDVPGDTWHASDVVYGWGLDGLKITLDPATPTADLYTIDSNTEHSLIVASPVLDLSSAITPGVTELMGVHEFETITLRGGAQVDFGVDRVVIKWPQDSLIDATSTLTADPASTLP